MSDPFIRARKTVYKLAAGVAAGLATARDSIFGILDTISHDTAAQAGDPPMMAWFVLLVLIVLAYLLFESGGEWMLEKVTWLRRLVAHPKDIEGAWFAAVFDNCGQFIAVAETRITYAGGCYQINGADFEFTSPTERIEKGQFKSTISAFLEEGGELIFQYVEDKDTEEGKRKKSIQSKNGYGMYIFHNGADSGFTRFVGSFVSDDAKKRYDVKAVRKNDFIKRMNSISKSEFKRIGGDYPLWLFQKEKRDQHGPRKRAIHTNLSLTDDSNAQ